MSEVLKFYSEEEAKDHIRHIEILNYTKNEALLSKAKSEAFSQLRQNCISVMNRALQNCSVDDMEVYLSTTHEDSEAEEAIVKILETYGIPRKAIKSSFPTCPESANLESHTYQHYASYFPTKARMRQHSGIRTNEEFTGNYTLTQKDSTTAVITPETTSSLAAYKWWEVEVYNPEEMFFVFYQLNILRKGTGEQILKKNNKFKTIPMSEQYHEFVAYNEKGENALEESLAPIKKKLHLNYFLHLPLMGISLVATALLSIFLLFMQGDFMKHMTHASEMNEVIYWFFHRFLADLFPLHLPQHAYGVLAVILTILIVTGFFCCRKNKFALKLWGWYIYVLVFFAIAFILLIPLPPENIATFIPYVLLNSILHPICATLMFVTNPVNLVYTGIMLIVLILIPFALISFYKQFKKTYLEETAEAYAFHQQFIEAQEKGYFGQMQDAVCEIEDFVAANRLA